MLGCTALHFVSAVFPGPTIAQNKQQCCKSCIAWDCAVQVAVAARCAAPLLIVLCPFLGTYRATMDGMNSTYVVSLRLLSH